MQNDFISNITHLICKSIPPYLINIKDILRHTLTYGVQECIRPTSGNLSYKKYFNRRKIFYAEECSFLTLCIITKTRKPEQSKVGKWMSKCE